MSICDDARAAGVDKVNAAFQPFIDEISTIIANMTSKGVDPTKYYDAKNNQVIDLLALLADLALQKQDQVKEVNDKVDNDCDQTVGFLQTVLDMVIAKYTKGLSLILPKHMTHIDVGQILAGKPLGGDNSIFNVVKDGVFDTLDMGENNDLRKVIDNPVTTTKTAVNKAFEKAGLPFRL